MLQSKDRDAKCQAIGVVGNRQSAMCARRRIEEEQRYWRVLKNAISTRSSILHVLLSTLLASAFRRLHFSLTCTTSIIKLLASKEGRSWMEVPRSNYTENDEHISCRLFTGAATMSKHKRVCLSVGIIMSLATTHAINIYCVVHG